MEYLRPLEQSGHGFVYGNEEFTVWPELPVQVNKQSGMRVVEKLKRDG
jgi:hypothetical protein